MLKIEVAKIPPEGLELSEPFAASDVQEPGTEEFALSEPGRLECRVELGDEQSVHVQGRLAARLGLVCGRCLEPFELAVDQKLELFYLQHRPDQGEEDEVELTERQMVVAYYRGPQIDLAEMVREQLHLGLPMKRLCREDCRGLCPRCGTNRNQSDCACPAEEPDPRLASLGKLFGR
jgi:uncharacterized protein